VAQTSRIEGLPFALLEAMACGRPVVAIGVGGVAELVEVGTTGLLAGPGDWEGIGNALLNLLAHPDQLQQMGQSARQRVEALFDLRTSVRLTHDLFSRLVNTKSGSQTNWPAKWPVANGTR
jgi:glycosyltransferase involved in cell wall biosynthesis